MLGHLKDVIKVGSVIGKMEVGHAAERLEQCQDGRQVLLGELSWNLGTLLLEERPGLGEPSVYPLLVEFIESLLYVVDRGRL